jgi:hypothetical protein
MARQHDFDPDRLLTTLNALAIVCGGLWALYEWHDFRKENERLTLEQQRSALKQAEVQMKELSLQTKQDEFAVQQQGIAKVQQELAVEQQRLQVEQQQFSIEQQGITKEQQQLAVEMAKASLVFQHQQNETSAEKYHQRRYEVETKLKIVRLAGATETRQGDRLYKVWFGFDIKNTSDRAFTICYNITDVYLADQADLLGIGASAAAIPFPPAVADKVYNRTDLQPWKKVAGMAHEYQGGSEDCRDGGYMVRMAGYERPIRGGGGTDIVQPGGSQSNSPAFIIRAKPTAWVGVSVTIGVGERYEFFNRVEPLEPGAGEKSIERWQDADAK